jgi:surfeit locus 1 family protein
MLRTLLSPRLLVSHLLVLVVVAGCLTAALWQWDRLGQARENNERLEARLQADPVDVAGLDGLRDGQLAPEELEFRRVEATGTFRPDEEVLQRNQSHRATQGLHVLTPLELADGTVVLVRRGWVPSDLDEPPVEQAPPPRGRCASRGAGALGRPAGDRSPGPRRPAGSTASSTPTCSGSTARSTVSCCRWCCASRRSSPASAELPLVLDAPTIDEGSHLSYTLQWLSFALIALITYGLWLRKRLRGTASAPTPRARRRALDPGHDAA